jgi:small subunit ribosomal protein S20
MQRLDIGHVRTSFFPSRIQQFFSVFLETGDVPKIDSAKKNMRKSRAANIRNRAQRANLRTVLKKAKAGDATAEAKLEATSLLDRAARKGLIHKNTAARHKSRMSKTAKAS